MKIITLAILGLLLTTGVFSYRDQLAKNNNFWEQNHLQSDGRGGFYDHKPGTGMWEDNHITPDNHGGFYNHKPGTDMWEDEHITSDGHGGLYYLDNNSTAQQ